MIKYPEIGEHLAHSSHSMPRTSFILPETSRAARFTIALKGMLNNSFSSRSYKRRPGEQGPALSALDTAQKPSYGNPALGQSCRIWRFLQRKSPFKDSPSLLQSATCAFKCFQLK